MSESIFARPATSANRRNRYLLTYRLDGGGENSTLATFRPNHIVDLAFLHVPTFPELVEAVALIAPNSDVIWLTPRFARLQVTAERKGA